MCATLDPVSAALTSFTNAKTRYYSRVDEAHGTALGPVAFANPCACMFPVAFMRTHFQNTRASEGEGAPQRTS